MSIDFIPNPPQQNASAIDFIPNNQPQNQASTFSRELGNGLDDLSAITLGLTKAGGNLTADVGTGLNYLGAHGVGQQLQNIGNTAAGVTPQQMGISNPGLRTSILSGVGQYAPYAAAEPIAATSDALASVPMIGRYLSPAIQKLGQVGGLYGATQSDPGHAVSGALENSALNVLAPAGIKAGADLGASTYQGLKNLLGLGSQDAADSIYNNLSKGLSKDDLNQQNVNNVIQNYNTQKQQISDGYNNFANSVSQNGYATSGKAPSITPLGEVIPGNGKFIAPSNDLSNQLNSFINNNPSKSGLSSIGAPIQSKITNYLASPTYLNAHSLQSALGEEAANFKSFNADQTDKATASALNSARSNLRNTITNTFNANGDQHLANSYQDLTNQYKTNVVPYMESPAIWKAINGGQFPQILNLLNKDDVAGKFQTIRNHLMQSPDQSQTVLAQALGQFAKKNADGAYSTNPTKFLSGYNNLPNNISQFAEPAGLSKQIESLQGRQNRLGTTQKVGNWLGHGAVTYGAFELLNHIAPEIKEIL